MSKKEIGKAVLWPGTPDETWGLCESQEITLEADKKEIQQGDGDTVGLLYTNCGRKKVSGTYTPLATAQATDPPKAADLVGTALTVKTQDGESTVVIYIDSASFKQKKGDVSEFSFEGYYYPSVVAGT